MCSIHLTPRCRRPIRGQVSLARLVVDIGTVSFTLPSVHFRTDEAPGARSVRATDKRAVTGASGVLLKLPVQPEMLVTTAVWSVTQPGEAEREVRHVVQWLLPTARTNLLSDDTWLWPNGDETPKLSPGDWPVMDITPSRHLAVHRRGITVIDTRNSKGHITRRYQSFPLVGIEARSSDRIPDIETSLN